MPSRRIPQTHTSRMHVFRKASLKGNATPPAEHPFSATRWARLNLTSATASARLYKDGLAAIDNKEQALGASTDTVAPRADTVLRLASHFFQVLDFAIERGDWPPAVREYHHRDKNEAILPELSTYDDAVEWAGYILAGETQRAVIEGGAFVAMAMPDTAKIQTALTLLNTALNLHTGHKSALITAQQAVETQLPGPTGIDKLILDLYNDVENYYRDLPDGARRDMCREWGLLYEGDPISGGDGGEDIPLPTAPQNPGVAPGPTDSGSVIFSWDANPAEEAVTGYKAYSGGTLLATVTGGAITAEITGFNPGDTVSLTVTALNATGEGPPSEAASGTAG